MKKITIIILLMLIGFTELNAQTKRETTLKPGIRTGVNFSRLINYNSDYKTGFYMGGDLAIKFNKVYTLQPEMIYSRQGANTTRSIDRIQVYNPSNNNFLASKKEESYIIDYLDMNVISKFYIGTGFHFLVGPSLNIKMSDNLNKSKPIPFDISLITGFGYSLPNGLSFEARYKQGIIDIFGFNYDNSDENINDDLWTIVLNQSFQLGVSYNFDIK